MERRFVLFLVLAFAVLFGHMALMSYLRPAKEGGDKVADRGQAAGARPDEEDQQQPAKPLQDQEKEQPPEPPEPVEPPEEPQDDGPEMADAEQEFERTWVTLGSADPAAPYRMLVMLDNRGAAVARIELSSPRYLELENRSGFLGHLVMDPTVLKDDPKEGIRVAAVGPHTPAAEAGLMPGDLVVTVGKEKVNALADFRIAMRAALPTRQVALTVLRGDQTLTLPMAIGAPVQVVGSGTPAAKAGLKPGDLILAVGSEKIGGAEDLRAVLSRTKPKQTVALTLAGREKQVEATLRRQPLEVIRPENNDPLSFLLTLHQIKGKGIQGRELPLIAQEEITEVGRELEGLNLWTGHWEVVEDETKQDRVVFRRRLPKYNLEIRKTFRLAKVPTEQARNVDFPAYHLVFDVEIRNRAEGPRTVAYQLDGPTGLPAEGVWYANKVGRTWGAVGLRDVVVSFNHSPPSLIGCPKIADNKLDPPWQDESLTYMGVDAQYFSSVLIPQKQDPQEIWFARSHPLRVGEVDAKLKKQTNTSCRMISKPYELAAGEVLKHQFVVFAGPKRPAVLAQSEYGLQELVYYGWFGWLAMPMSQILHFFYGVVASYGLAIIMLTVVVRGCMFPISRKQALGAQKMQELQPEIKKIQEKYKKDMEARTKAQQELFRKHNYNPLSGCLVLFIQLPIFIALYRSLMVDIELRQAPLLLERIRWCSNLAAPDMLFDWSGFMPLFVTSGVGFFGLGPYFNLLPILTIVLFIAQQKMFMPPPADEQAAMQQKIMKYMMVFMGLIFFKVASGLCIYFIASSLWGLAERKLLPKPRPATPAGKPESRPQAKPQPRPQVKSPPQQTTTGGGDGAAPRRKKRKSKRGKR